MATHLKIKEFEEKSGGGIYNEKVREIHEKLKVRERLSYFANVLENVDIACFISIFGQMIRVVNATFCYTTEKGAREKNIVSYGKVRENENVKIMTSLFSL